MIYYADKQEIVQKISNCYIRLTELIPELLELVDERKIALNPAYELSFLKKEEQTKLLDAMESEPDDTIPFAGTATQKIQSGRSSFPRCDASNPE